MHTSLLMSPVKSQIWISAADNSFIIYLGVHEQLMCILQLLESWCSFWQLTLVENLCRCACTLVKVVLAVLGYVLPFASTLFPLTNGNATVSGFVSMSKHAANDLVLQMFVRFGRSKWGSLMEQASCQLSPVMDNVLWIEFQTLELNWYVTCCKHKTSRLNIWAVFHLYCKADFCSPALHGLVGRHEDAVWVQRGMCAPGLHVSHHQSHCWKQRSVQCVSSWHILAVFSLSQGKQYTWEVLSLHRVMSFRSQTMSLPWKMMGHSIVFRLVSPLPALWPLLLSLQ